MRAWPCMTILTLAILGVLSVSFLEGMAMGAEAEKRFPSIAVEAGEISLPSDSVFAETCFAKAQKLAAIGGWQLHGALLTFSKEWGLIWRGDLTDPKSDIVPLINRVICWQSPSSGEIQITMAIGQNTSRLVDHNGLGNHSDRSIRSGVPRDE